MFSELYQTRVTKLTEKIIRKCALYKTQKIIYNIFRNEVNIMSFGINGSDPFKSYSSNADAGGGMGVYARKRPKKDKQEKEKKEEEKSTLDLTEDDDDVDVEIDFEDTDFLD
jgi:hypothetical protein